MNRRPTEPKGKAAKLPSQNPLATKLKAISRAAESRPAREATQRDLDRHSRMQKMEQDEISGFTDTTRMKYMTGGYAKGGTAAATAVRKHERNMHKGETPTKLAKGGAAKSACGTAPVKKAAGGAMPMPAKRKGVPVASREPMIKR